MPVRSEALLRIVRAAGPGQVRAAHSQSQIGEPQLSLLRTSSTASGQGNMALARGPGSYPRRSWRRRSSARPSRGAAARPLDPSESLEELLDQLRRKAGGGLVKHEHRGSIISARAIASIWRCPPLIEPASWPSRSRRTGKRPKTMSNRRLRSARSASAAGRLERAGQVLDDAGVGEAARPVRHEGDSAARQLPGRRAGKDRSPSSLTRAARRPDRADEPRAARWSSRPRWSPRSTSSSPPEAFERKLRHAR